MVHDGPRDGTLDRTADARRDLVGEYGDVDDVKTNWDVIFQRHAIGWTILPTKHPLCRLLERRGDWVKVHEAGGAVIFSRTDGGAGRGGR